MKTTENIKKLREKTGAGIMECKSVLTEAAGDIDKATVLLRKRGLLMARQKADRVAKEGRIEIYLHTNAKIGVLIEVNCETDFVAECDDFKEFTRNLAIQVAASNPLCVSKEGIAPEEIEKEREIIRAQIKDKPESVIEKIIDGKIQKYYEEVCLLEQPFVKDDKLKIHDYLNFMVGKIRENIVIKRFVRYELGERLPKDAD
ncbi:MAG: translation elongation factor Ts [Candidatus Omnitrophica bacterium]|nr:translation elongation factor Ts [Candidatus Omnitrophota bacterium]